MSDIALPNQSRPASQGTVIEQTRAAAEVAAAVSVARNFPRAATAATEQMRELCSRLSVANRAFYEVPNRGAGMSVHIARELARIWGNLDYGVRELGRDDASGMSEMQVWAWDVEANVRSTRSFLQPHAKSLKGGKRQALTDLNDIYLNNQNTGARAVRECLFTVLPGWFMADAEAILRKTLEHGDGKPIEERRADVINAFVGLNVSQKKLETRLRAPLAKWSPSHIAELGRVYQSITQDGIPAREFFPEEAVAVMAAPAVAEPSESPADPMQRTPEEQAEDAVAS
ncbi:hypothetical protein D6T64_11840 [Cryobacterium melibiosiphilum]|uniref:Uncharacterized protein n=1 Tax=Cryobacterium melibiosiphilum TaxID=995039 RepID=A0A3A5MRR4_9MICO|nr:hypothetical protein [Cryobacterium melibiosiphilum]RJT88074.1 hypothetical protein D6T64_11840 [Cryobacterium melibiosiphilum]